MKERKNERKKERKRERKSGMWLAGDAMRSFAWATSFLLWEYRLLPHAVEHTSAKLTKRRGYISLVNVNF